MPASIANSRSEAIKVRKIEYSCRASEKPQPGEYGECPSATSPYYYLETEDYSKVKAFYEQHKNLPFCRISAAKSMKRKYSGGASYWTDYDLLYHKRDGWLEVPILSPTFV
jgi:hypothetical protein